MPTAPLIFNAEAIFGPDGLLAQRISGFVVRPQQVHMAAAVAETLAARSTLVVEAATGTGKTYAYLAPVLAARRKTLISTATKTLQDQLFQRDLPRLVATLGTPVQSALLKGRGNYLCLYRLERHPGGGNRSEAAALARITLWARGSSHGDLNELDLPEHSALHTTLTSSAENCLGQACPHVGECFVMRARRAAQEADIVVINHHLLCADLALRAEGVADLLPQADVYVLDEAHAVAETAGHFFGHHVSLRQLLQLTSDTLQEAQREASDMPDLISAALSLADAAEGFRAQLGAPRRAPWNELTHDAVIPAAGADLSTALSVLITTLALAAGRAAGLANCHTRAIDLQMRWALLTGLDAGDGLIRWVEITASGFHLHATPEQVAAQFSAAMAATQATWVFTSATLAVGDTFEHYTTALGLEQATTLLLDSPFDYARRTLLYLPPALPDPAQPGYTRAITKTVIAVLNASRGRAFVLFTSHRALREVREQLADALPYPLLVQGELPKAQLLARYRALGNAVLLGSASLWEGVDVPGSALSCVIIDKLPFAAVGDPVLAARLDALRTRGGNPFTEQQLPAAVIALKQGAGRLIRAVTDRGVLVLCDPRLTTRGYGRLFLRSLPDMPTTRALADVERFFRDERAA